MSWEWDNLMRGSPGFRFNDNQNYLYDRDIMHKRNSEEKEETENVLPTNLEDWGEFNDFSGLMEDASLYPSSLGLFDRTILTRVQKRASQDQEETEVKKRELKDPTPRVDILNKDNIHKYFDIILEKQSRFRFSKFYSTCTEVLPAK